jgi:hypothetical protein
VQLRFELGDAQAPRGHAIVYAHLSSPSGPLLATYCIVLPIAFSIGKYLPPMFAAQLPLEGLREAATMSVVPVPPMLEEVPGVAALRQLAERRGDDLCDMGTLLVNDDSQRMLYAAEAAQAYGQVYASYSESWPEIPAAGSAAAPAEELEVEDVLAEVLNDRDRLSELARAVGRMRYAIEGHDTSLMTETERGMRRMAAGLADKYRADQLIEAALQPDDRGARLAQLYLERAYKLLDEVYTAIPPIEQQIRELREQA